MKRLVLPQLLLLGMTGLPGGQGSVPMPAPAAAADRVITERDVPVPMRDGVVLRADVLRPRVAAGERVPVLVYRTPYGKHVAPQEYTTFRRAAARGYAVVIQDVRGRYASAGEFRPYQNEGRDGYDTIEWAARQPWSNGAVGTFGLSYPGAVQWLAAVEGPPHLKAMVPAMTFSTPQNFFYAGGAWDLSWLDWFWHNIAPDVRVRKDLPGPRTYDEAAATWNRVGLRIKSTVPLDQVEELRGLAPSYFEWLSHPPEDPWWDWCELRGKYDRVQAAVLNLSGWYDDNYGSEGAITNFTGLIESRRGERGPRTHLLMGPWLHGVDSLAQAEAGERRFGAGAAIDYDEVILRWMDHHLRGIDNGVADEKRVRYFVMGADQWRDDDAWPPAARRTSYYLISPEEESKRGSLSPNPPQQDDRFSVFVSDPAAPVTNPYDTGGAHDYRRLSDRSDVLSFDSAPLERDTELTGPIQARIHLACDCRDTDLWVRLLDLAPDGTALNVISPGLDVLRASYRDPAKGRQLLTPGEVYELRLGNLVTSNVFKKSHRIRIQISATFFPNFSRNPHTGDSESVSAKMQKARIRIYTDRSHPSQVILPSPPFISM